MSLYQLRPLGLRETLVAFELQRGPLPANDAVRDPREAFTLWNPQGRPHTAFPEVPILHAMTGRELMLQQQAAWRAHVATTRRLFGAAPLSGIARSDAPVRGLLTFPIAHFSERGRWMVAHRLGFRWYFTPTQLRDGLPYPVPPAVVDKGA